MRGLYVVEETWQPVTGVGVQPLHIVFVTEIADDSYYLKALDREVSWAELLHSCTAFIVKQLVSSLR